MRNFLIGLSLSLLLVAGSTYAIGALLIDDGGTGATTAQGARTNLLPSQSGNSGEALLTDGSDTYWGTVSTGGFTATSTFGNTKMLNWVSNGASYSTWTNMPTSTADFLMGSTTPNSGSAYYKKYDLNNVYRFRTVRNLSVAGYAGSYVYLEYSTDRTNWSRASTNDDCTLVGTGVVPCPWATLATGAQTDVYLRYRGTGGNDVIDPRFYTLVTEFTTYASTDDENATSTEAISFVVSPTANQTWSNMPLAKSGTYYNGFGSAYHYKTANLYNSNNYRISATIATTTNVNYDPLSTMRIDAQCSYDKTNWFNLNSGSASPATGTGELDISQNVNTVNVGSWASIAETCKGNVYLRFVGYGGNGVKDIYFRNLEVQVDGDLEADVTYVDNNWVLSGGVLSPTTTVPIDVYGASSTYATTTNLIVNNGITLGGVTRTTWPSGVISWLYDAVNDYLYPATTTSGITVNGTSTLATTTINGGYEPVGPGVYGFQVGGSQSVSGSVFIGDSLSVAKNTILQGDATTSGNSYLAATTMVFDEDGNGISFGNFELGGGLFLPQIKFSSPNFENPNTGVMSDSLIIYNTDPSNQATILLTSVDGDDSVNIRYATTTQTMQFTNGYNYEFSINHDKVTIGTTIYGTPIIKFDSPSFPFGKTYGALRDALVIDGTNMNPEIRFLNPANFNTSAIIFSTSTNELKFEGPGGTVDDIFFRLIDDGDYLKIGETDDYLKISNRDTTYGALPRIEGNSLGLNAPYFEIPGNLFISEASSSPGLGYQGVPTISLAQYDLSKGMSLAYATTTGILDIYGWGAGNLSTTSIDSDIQVKNSKGIELGGVWRNTWPTDGAFSTTSTDYWETQQSRWSTTSSNYLLGTYDKGYFWSTTSADVWDGTKPRWATTSSDYWYTKQNKNPFDQWLDSTSTATFGGLNVNGNATTTNLAITGITGSFLATDGTGMVIATTSPRISGITGQIPYFSSTNTQSATSSIFLSTAGNVGISTSTPQFALVVGSGHTVEGLKSIQVPYGSLCVDNDGYCTPSGTAGNITARSYTTGGADLAENYISKNVEAGDIVSPLKNLGMKKATDRNSMFGVISTNPGMIIGTLEKFTGKKPLALAGRVPVKVNMEGGKIKVGDRITLSSVAGVGCKATSSTQTIGIALDETNKSGKIRVFINLGYSKI